MRMKDTMSKHLKQTKKEVFIISSTRTRSLPCSLFCKSLKTDMTIENVCLLPFLICSHQVFTT